MAEQSWERWRILKETTFGKSYIAYSWFKLFNSPEISVIVLLLQCCYICFPVETTKIRRIQYICGGRTMYNAELEHLSWDVQMKQIEC